MEDIISEEYFDANGRPLEFEVFLGIVRAHDKRSGCIGRIL